ncbi:serine/threonine-protein kinase [Sphaerisporangium sp. B11E5]|uniref:serine/threonine-protein kinase n=1 Tax=Sphaerisporangium sp. B11E5 TaxID=3153563 RepID=UPI00325DB06E
MAELKADAAACERVVAGRYRLVEQLGCGGMGVVWRALDLVLGREVAVKELRGVERLTPQEREVFCVRTFREARAAGRIGHPGVAAVYDVFAEDGYPWIVMQLVSSRTLRAVAWESGGLTPRRVAEIGSQVLEALTAAHEAGVLHRDVKPENVLIGVDGRAVLTDFGVAALEDDGPMTRTGVLVGTPAYVAPERAVGGAATRASDLWSLGVTLYQVVEGHSPFQRANVLATLAAIMNQEPPPMRNAGPLAPVIEGLLAKEPEDRMGAAEAAQLLAAVAAGQELDTPGRVHVGGGRAARGTAPMPAVARRPRVGVVVAVGASTLMAGVVVGGAAYLTGRPDRGVTGAAVPTVTVIQTWTVSPAPPSSGATPQAPVTGPGPGERGTTPGGRAPEDGPEAVKPVAVAPPPPDTKPGPRDKPAPKDRNSSGGGGGLPKDVAKNVRKNLEAAEKKLDGVIGRGSGKDK